MKLRLISGNTEIKSAIKECVWKLKEKLEEAKLSDSEHVTQIIYIREVHWTPSA